MTADEIREYNMAARIHNEGTTVNVALGPRFRTVAERIAREGKMAVSVARTAAAPEHNPLNDLKTMRSLASRMRYRLDTHPMRSTVGDSWTMTSGREFLELQVAFGDDGRVSVYALPLDPNEQETLAEAEDVETEDGREVLRMLQKVRSKAVADPLVEHLRLEMGFR